MPAMEPRIVVLAARYLPVVLWKLRPLWHHGHSARMELGVPVDGETLGNTG